jgi:hypothetical protein
MGLTGLGGELLQKYGEDFNKTQNEYKVVVSFKGQYPEQRAAAVAAFRAGNPPHIMQMFDAGSGDMMSARNAIVPVSEVFKRAGLQFDPADFIAPARGYYGLPSGDLLSMPFNVSTTVLFWNKDAFRKAGLDPEKPPRTWPELIKAAQQIRKTNAAACGYTTAWLAWIVLEQFSSRHNLPLGTQGNGRAKLNADLKFNTPLRQRRVHTLVDMQKDKSFDYGGRSNDVAAKYISDECAAALIAGRQGRAVRHRHRRCLAVGVQRSQALGRRVPRRGAVPELPAFDAGDERLGQADRPPAGHDDLVRGDAGRRLLGQEPGQRCADPVAHQRAHRRAHQRLPLRPLDRDPRCLGRGTRVGVAGQAGRERGDAQRPAPRQRPAARARTYGAVRPVCGVTRTAGGPCRVRRSLPKIHPRKSPQPPPRGANFAPAALRRRG